MRPEAISSVNPPSPAATGASVYCERRPSNASGVLIPLARTCEKLAQTVYAALNVLAICACSLASISLQHSPSISASPLVLLLACSLTAGISLQPHRWYHSAASTLILACGLTGTKVASLACRQPRWYVGLLVLVLGHENF